MTRYAVTGVSRELVPEEKLAIMAAVMSLPDVTEFTTGCAYGVDTAAHQAVVQCHPSALKRLVVPAAPHNAQYVGTAACESIPWVVEHAPEGSTSARSYMLRNDVLVSHADVMLAFPDTEQELWRGSGTWATIRRARKAGVKVRLYPLDRCRAAA